MTAVVLAGAWEWSAFLRVPATSARGAYVLLVAALLALAWRVSASPGGGAPPLAGGGGWGVVGPPLVAFAARGGSPPSAGAARGLALGSARGWWGALRCAPP